MTHQDLQTDVLVVGAGLGGIAAALAAADRGARVVLTEEHPWIGGQLTSQAVPPDEHPWVEKFGVTTRYRALRDGIRDVYRRRYPLTAGAQGWQELNPGAGWVSKLCHEPRVAVGVLEEMLAPYRSAGRIQLLERVRPVAATTDGDRVTSVTLTSVVGRPDTTVSAAYTIDATETGELLPLTGTEYVTGFESARVTGEPSAPDEAQPDNVQALSVCFAVEHVDGDHTIDRPDRYDFWRSYAPAAWGGERMLSWTAPNPRTLALDERSFTPNPGDDPLAVDADQSKNAGDGNLWLFRRIAARDLHAPGFYAGDLCLVNWPSIDYFLDHVLDVPREVEEARIADARQLSLSMLYWMQTEAPRADGGTGFPGLRLRPDVMGSADGLAQAAYHRESRRIQAVTTITENDVSYAVRGDRGATRYEDSVGVGMYRIDLHPSTGGDTYIDVPSTPFEIPLGALLPQRTTNLLAGNKNIGTTHITNGCYRLHPVEWNVGEAAGHLAAHCLATGRTPHAVQAKPELLADYQAELVAAGVELRWPDGVHPY
ncbi:FAD dependent oxidoreductase [Promicromonospora umidemergens]|uniref:FAD-dependent oxidoreductase n=1 Tax=Promicromonospora umidemergens TaxID=629679 RepID=A0ABP8Y1U8_9MICO|nr:FAD-dependent oxidoreductase [Promicromonospora umidemergens]MCP2286328.1 FAD dependent oxidoreductase [Promicromonospora umidemergens]